MIPCRPVPFMAGDARERAMRSTIISTVSVHRSAARARAYVATLLAVFVAACGGGGGSPASTLEPTPAPVAISSLAPASALAGGADFVLSVGGSGFVSGSV